MLTRSGTPYLREEVSDSMASQPILADFMAKLDALTHDLAQARADLHETKEQVKEISCRESSTAGENSSSSRNNHRDNTNNPPNSDDQYPKNIKIDVPTFDGRHDPQLFLDWTLQLDKYFTW